MKTSKIVEQITGDLPSKAIRFHSETSIDLLDNMTDPNNWPAEWKKVHFKLYPRLKQKRLDNPKMPKKDLKEVIISRKSSRDFYSHSLSREEISSLLFFSVGIMTKNEDWDQSKRTYPSAGARYPLEVYPVILRSKDPKPGLYHYNVKEHILELLLEGEFGNNMMELTGQDWVEKASMVFVISAAIKRSAVKYGDRAYRYCAIEAGHIGQNIYLLSEALNLKCCAIGGFVDKEINSLLDLDEENEFVIYILAVGK